MIRQGTISSLIKKYRTPLLVLILAGIIINGFYVGHSVGWEFSARVPFDGRATGSGSTAPLWGRLLFQVIFAALIAFILILGIKPRKR